MISMILMEKQPPDVFYEKLLLWLKLWLWLRLWAQMFSCEFCEIFKNTFFTEHDCFCSCNYSKAGCNYFKNIQIIGNNAKNFSSYLVSPTISLHILTPSMLEFIFWAFLKSLGSYWVKNQNEIVCNY